MDPAYVFFAPWQALPWLRLCCAEPLWEKNSPAKPQSRQEKINHEHFGIAGMRECAETNWQTGDFAPKNGPHFFACLSIAMGF